MSWIALVISVIALASSLHHARRAQAAADRARRAHREASANLARAQLAALKARQLRNGRQR